MNDSSPPKPSGPMIQDELALSHTFTNYLSAGYQGKFAFLNLLAQTGHPSFSDRELKETQAVLENAAGWRTKVLSGKSIFPSRESSALSDEGTRIFSLLESLRPNHFKLSQELESILGSVTDTLTKNQLGFLAAAYARNAYIRDNFMRGNLEFAKRNKLDKVVEECEFFLQQTKEETNLANSFLSAAQAEDVAQPYIDIILGESRILPGAFRVHNNDLSIVLASYAGTYTFDKAGIPGPSAKAWQEVGIEPEQAGDWEAHRIPAPEAVLWMQLNSPYIYSANAAAAWRTEGFTPDDFLIWAEREIRPYHARMWKQGGFDPTEAADFASKGILAPNLIPPDQAPDIEPE